MATSYPIATSNPARLPNWSYDSVDPIHDRSTTAGNHGWQFHFPSDHAIETTEFLFTKVLLNQPLLISCCFYSYALGPPELLGLVLVSIFDLEGKC
jgi:hypothetical protein